MNNHSIHTQRRQLGLTLVELLVAMLIGVFLIGGISQIFIATKQSNGVLVAETELQENARFAFSVITGIVQQAGNFGCRAPSDTNTKSLLNFTDNTFRPWVAIEGWEARNTAFGDTYTPAVSAKTLVTPDTHWTGTNDATLSTGISSVKKSDILKIWHTADKSATLTSVTADTLTFSEMDLEKGDVVVLNDCKTVTFAQVCACETSDAAACSGIDERADISQTSCNTPGNKAFDPAGINIATADLQLLKQSMLFIGKRNQNNSNLTSLFIHKLGKDGKIGERDEILEGVESMQIQYGEDTNNNNSPNYYVTADQVSDWRNIISIRISLLMRSFKGNLVEKQNINFNGAKVSIPTGDSHLRRVYSSTIALRNRNIGY